MNVEAIMESLEQCVREQIEHLSRLYLEQKAAYKNNYMYSHIPELVRREGVGFLTGLYYADVLNKFEWQTLILKYFPLN